MVFVKAGAEEEEEEEEEEEDPDESVASSKTGGSSKKRWSLFGKKGRNASRGASAARAEEEITGTFEAGPLGLSVTNDPKRGNALLITKAAGQAETNGIQVGDEVIFLNGEACRGVKSDEFKKLIVAAGRPFDLTVVRSDGDDGETHLFPFAVQLLAPPLW